MNTQASRVVSGDQKPAGIEQIRKQVLQAIQDVHYGSVEITVHDGKIVQIERKEKIRLSDSALKHRHEFTAALWQQASPTGRTEA
ncbi:MAG: YezD family protein [Verrucomicrobia bacterium]|nr:YezD family protein [Verrucomicrobiota bacterium]